MGIFIFLGIPFVIHIDAKANIFGIAMTEDNIKKMLFGTRTDATSLGKVVAEMLELLSILKILSEIKTGSVYDKDTSDK